MKIYICGSCKFTFERSGEVEACSDCGRVNVRLAEDDEIKAYIKMGTALKKERDNP